MVGVGAVSKAGSDRASFDSRVAAYALLAAAMGVMLATVWHTLGPQGVLSAWDAAGHLLKAEYWAGQLLPLGRSSGWFPIWHGGFDLFQFYPPLLYYLLGPLSLVFDGELALRAFMCGLWLALVPANYYFLRGLGLERGVAALGASLVLSLNASLGVGLGALYGVGLLPNGLGIVVATLFLGRLVRVLATDPDERTPRSLVAAGLLLAVLILSHTFSTYWCLLAASVLVLSHSTEGRQQLLRNARDYALVLAVALAVSAFWWLPLLVMLDHMGPPGRVVEDGPLEILARLLFARESGGWPASLLAVAGLLSLAWRRDFARGAALALVFVVTLLLCVNAINSWLPFASVVSSSQRIRFEAFAAWLLMVFGALGIDGLWRVVRSLPLQPRLPALLLTLVALVWGALVVWPTVRANSRYVDVRGGQPLAEISALNQFLGDRLRTGEFVLTEFSWDAVPTFGSPHILNQRLPRELPGFWDLDGNFPEGTAGATQPVLIASALPRIPFLRSQQEYLRGRGVRYVITTVPGTRQALREEAWLTRVWGSPNLTVFELSGARRFGLPAELAEQVEALSYEPPGVYEVRFARPVEAPSSFVVGLSYHPWLVAESDRSSLSLTNENGQLHLTSGPQPIQSLTIRYRPTWISGVAGAFSLLALLLALGVCFAAVRSAWVAGRAP